MSDPLSPAQSTFLSFQPCPFTVPPGQGPHGPQSQEDQPCRAHPDGLPPRGVLESGAWGEPDIFICEPGPRPARNSETEPISLPLCRGSFCPDALPLSSEHQEPLGLHTGRKDSHSALPRLGRFPLNLLGTFLMTVL